MMKFHNPWTIRTPRGWSCLFVPPLNRPDGVIEVLSGVVDTDVYVSPINFPFVAVAEDGVHILSKGTPLMQVIPFAREDERLEGEVRAESEEEEAAEREPTSFADTRGAASGAQFAGDGVSLVLDTQTALQ